ncbi:MAG: hypothetical protein V3T99_05910 [Nitrososphaerales archaeon]
MSDLFRTVVRKGTINDNAIVEVLISDEAIDLWAPVIVVAPAVTADNLPDVEPIAVLNTTTVIGIAVGGEQGKETTSLAASAADENVRVVTFGFAKCKVNGNSVNIVIGDGLVTTTTDGRAVKVDYTTADNVEANINTAILATNAIFAKACQASTADGDIIAVFVRPSGGASA